MSTNLDIGSTVSSIIQTIAQRLDVEQMKEMLLKLDYVREELAKFKAKA